MTYRDLVTSLTITTALLLPLLATTSAKASQLEADSPDWYQVEVIIFAHHPRDPQTSEQWRDQMDLEYPDNLEVLRRYIPPSVQPPAEQESTDLLDQTEYLSGIFSDEQLPDQTPQPADIEPIENSAAPNLVEQEPPTETGEIAIASDVIESSGIEPSAIESSAVDANAIESSAVELTPIDLTQLPTLLPEPVDLGREPFILLPQDKFQLSGLKKRIDRALDMRLLTHMAWRQPAYPKKQSAPVLIQSGDQYGLSFEIEGTITVSENRFLHVETHLYFSKFIRQLLDEKIDWSSLANEETEGFVFGDTGTTTAQQPFSVFSQNDVEFDRDLTAEFKQARRVRSEELHYLDHPLFGMMVMISHHELPDPVMEMEEFDTEQLPSKRPMPIISISPDVATSAP